MMRGRLILGLVAAAAVCACGGDSTSSEATSTSGGGGMGSGAGGSGGGVTASSSTTGGGGMFSGPMVTYTGNISHALTMEGLANADVCVTEPNAGCVQTDGNGDYVFPGVPANTRIRVRAELATYFPVEGLIDVTDMDGTQDAVMLPVAIAQAILLGQGVTFDETKPAISVGVIDDNGDGVAGYSVLLTPMGGEGPFYLTDTGIDDTAVATTSTGQAVFVNLDIGEYDVGVVGPGTCVSSSLMAPNNTQPAPLQNASLFAAFFTCQ